MNDLADLEPFGEMLSELRTSQALVRSTLSHLDHLQRQYQLKEDRENREAVLKECASFAGFVKRAWHVLEPGTDLVWNWHMQAICDHLQAITEGRLKPRLIINVPPGMSKSLIVSVMWQAWQWGPRNDRTKKFLSTSFSLDTVERDTRKTRDLILSAWFQEFWPTNPDHPDRSPLKRAGETSFESYEFGTREGTAFKSVTGKRGDVFTIDDPHSLDGAESDEQRSKTVRMFLEGGLNRLNDANTSAIVVVMQRLHENDLSGALLDAKELGFVHLMLPMRFEPERVCRTPLGFVDPRYAPGTETEGEGELLDPVRFPEEVVQTFELFEYSFAGQYQQRPTPREGGMFKVGKIELVDQMPQGHGERVRGWDLAASTKSTSPYTAGVRVSKVGPYFYIEDMRRDRWTSFEVDENILLCAEEDERIDASARQDIPQDPGAAGKAWKNSMALALVGHNFGFSVESGSKEQRALPVSSAVAAGLFRMVKGPWNSALIEELRNFPNSKFKDGTDALSRAFAKLMTLIGGEDTGEAPEVHTPTEEEPQTSNDITDPFLD